MSKLSAISWDDEVLICFGYPGSSKDDFLNKAKEKHQILTGEKMPDTFKISRNKYNTWILKLEVQ